MSLVSVRMNQITPSKYLGVLIVCMLSMHAVNIKIALEIELGFECRTENFVKFFFVEKLQTNVIVQMLNSTGLQKGRLVFNKITKFQFSRPL